MNTLIIGGSGMLSGVCEYCLAQGDEVYIYSRTTDKQAFRYSEVKWVQGDYTLEAFKNQMKEFIEKYSPKRIIIWMHTSGEENFKWLMEYYKGRVFHVNSSSEYQKEFIDYGAKYHRIILGKHNSGTRWLSHNEISKGVVNGMNRKEKVFLVGSFE
jgi:hypothetical protein